MMIKLIMIIVKRLMILISLSFIMNTINYYVVGFRMISSTRPIVHHPFSIANANHQFNQQYHCYSNGIDYHRNGRYGIRSVSRNQRHYFARSNRHDDSTKIDKDMSMTRDNDSDNGRNSGSLIPDYVEKALKLFEKQNELLYQNNNINNNDRKITLTSDANGSSDKDRILATIAVIGRPNTGKSTLVNRISQSFKDGAIVHDQAGITRDRTYHICSHNDKYFQVVDTGGILFDDYENDKQIKQFPTLTHIREQVTEQALQSLNEADVCFFVVDGMSGVHPLDIQVASWLRKSGMLDRNHSNKGIRRPMVFLVVNKCESWSRGSLLAQEFWSLGIENVIPVSAIHGDGVSNLLDTAFLSASLPSISELPMHNVTNVAIIGRPNVGKSSLFNRFLGTKRAIVSNIAGTTRDSIDAEIVRHGHRYRIVDTAGIRIRRNMDPNIEYFMVNRALKSLRRADVVVLVLDAVQGVVEQDRILAKRIHEEGKACVILLNKWDAIPDKDDRSYLDAEGNVRQTLSDLSWAEIVLVSAASGLRIDRVWPAVSRAVSAAGNKVSSSALNDVVQDAILYQAPPMLRGRAARVYFCTQVAVSPPTIELFVNDPKLFPSSYLKYLERKIRENCGFAGTSICLRLKGKSVRRMALGKRRSM